MQYVPNAPQLLLCGMCRHTKANYIRQEMSTYDWAFLDLLPSWSVSLGESARFGEAWQRDIRKTKVTATNPTSRKRKPKQRYYFEPRAVGMHLDNVGIRVIAKNLGITKWNVEQIIDEYYRGPFQLNFEFLYQMDPVRVAPPPINAASRCWGHLLAEHVEIQLQLPIPL